MPRQAEPYPLQKVTLNLFEGDFDYLREMHGQLGAGKTIRHIVRAYINNVKNAADQKSKPAPALPID